MNLRKSFLIAIFTVCIGCLLNVNAYASTKKVTRLAGDDRYKTSVEISKSVWKDGSSQGAILATGENYPDALSAAPFAKKINAPILLTNKDQLNTDTEAELTRLGVKTVYIVGGTGVISPAVESKLKSMKIDTIRLAGKDRYETSVKIAEQLDAPKQLAVTTGEDFSDALSIAPFAASKNMPIILVPKGYVPDCVTKYVLSVKIDKTYIVGGTDIISDAVSKSFSNPYRITGSDEYQRNIEVIKTFSNDIYWHTMYIATGNHFPDALSGSVIASKEQSPIILVGNIPAAGTKNFIDQKKALVTEYKVLGGEGAVSQIILDSLLPADRSIDKGTIDGSSYKNDQLGFKLSWPKEWVVDSDDLFSDEDGSVLLCISRYPLDSEKDNYDLECTAYDLSNDPDTKTAKDFLNSAVDFYESVGSKVNENIYSQVIGDKSFDVLDVRMTNNENVLNQRLYCTIVNNYAITFTISYTDADGMNNLINVMNTIEFTK